MSCLDLEISYQKIMDIIHELNCELYEQTNNDYIYLEYMTNSFAEVINFLGCQIWNSEDDCRNYIDEEKDIKEDLETYLRREINNWVSNINKIKL
jgi:hypothetical protein